jgi:DNA-binding response OmpR family regulator
VPTVLIVESDPLIRNLLRDTLSDAGYTVLDAVNRAEAIQLLRAMPGEEVDLAILEHRVDNGAESVADEIESLHPSAKILLTLHRTAAPDPAGRVFLRHPFTDGRLLEIVSGLVNPSVQ